jgi:protoheme IX farnesyltransferase
MALEGETDALMRRTRGRPEAAARERKNDAMAFGVILSLFSVMLLGMNANWLAAGLLALTIVYYAGFYTLLLKRRTPQNIVIGGAAGAFPPVIGWAAATGQAPWQAWLLFAIIFLWTPPHSWALALYSAGDYAKAADPDLQPDLRADRHRAGSGRPGRSDLSGRVGRRRSGLPGPGLAAVPLARGRRAGQGRHRGTRGRIV